METQSLIRLKGIVIAAGWGPNGEVTVVDIAGYDEKRYRVADNHIRRQLRSSVKKRIVADGRLCLDNLQELFYIQKYWIDDNEKD